MCDRVGIIREGELIGERVISEMAHEAAQTFDITFADKSPLAKLKALKGAKIVASDGNRLTVHYHGPLSPFLTELAQHKVVAMDTQQLDLEEVFLRFYSQKEAK